MSAASMGSAARRGVLVNRIILALCAILPILAEAQPVIKDVVNAASYVGGVVSPGEMVLVFGTGLGPAGVVSASLDASGRVSSSLANVSATFNGIPSPLVYVSASQIAAMVPYELAGLTTASLQLDFAGLMSAPFTVKIAAANPGIFSADASGQGNIAANNSDGSLNSPSHAAAPGSYVTFYLTGEGQTTPAGSDGSIATGQSSINPQVTVTIGGLEARVLYAGSAPYAVNGFAQINAVVPTDLKYGGNLPLFVQIGNVTSQPGLTVAVSGPSAPLSASMSFSPSASTLPTSEGAPYGYCDFWLQGPLVAGTEARCTNESRLGYGPTKVTQVWICLTGKVGLDACAQQPQVTGPLSADILNSINAGIAAFAGTGVRILLRFTYNAGPQGAADAPLSVMLTHIDQLAPILLQNADQIFALEAGFIGEFGEWHDSTNGNDTPAAHTAILDKELAYFSGVFPIVARQPGDLIAIAGPVPTSALGIHDDFYASSSDDANTWDPCKPDKGYCLTSYNQSQMMSYGSAVSTTSMFVGEFGQVYPPLQACDALDAYSYTFHVQSLAIFKPDADQYLSSEGCGLAFFNRVGTRLVLRRTAISGDATPGGRISIALTIGNEGYGRVIRARPATLLLIQKGETVAKIPLPLQSFDLRTVGAFTSQTFQFDFLVPATVQAGPTSMALLIPDPAPSLSSQAAYALPLNSLDQNGNPIFEIGSGNNFVDGAGPTVGPAFQLGSAGMFTSNADEVIDGAYSIKGAYFGTDVYTAFLRTVPAALAFTPNHSYKVTFRYKILTTPTAGATSPPDIGFQMAFVSAASGGYLPSLKVMGKAGDTGTATWTNTLSPYADYEVQWNVIGTGAISIDDIEITDAGSGQIVGSANAEPTLNPLLNLHP